MTEYDGRSKTEITTSPEGRSATVVFDSLGRPERTSITGLFPTSIRYDAHGRVVSITRGAGDQLRTWTTTYQPDGYVSSQAGPMDGAITLYEPDVMGRPEIVTRADGLKILSEFDRLGQVRFLAPPGKPSHEMRYDPVGLLTHYIAPVDQPGAMHPTDQRTFDLERWPTLLERPDGRTTTFVHDPSTGRLQRMNSASENVTLGYNASSGKAETLTMTDALGQHVLTQTHDGALPVKTTWSGGAQITTGSVEWEYNDDFLPEGISVNDTQVATFGYDEDDLLAQVGALTIDRSPQNGLITGTTVGALQTTQTVDGFGELKLSRASFGAQVLYEDQIQERDKLGRLKSRSQTVLDTSGAATTVARTYTYDQVGRLVDVQSSGGTSVARYEYDGNGNRTARIDAYGSVIGSYDAQDRLTLYCPRDAQGQPAPIAELPCFEYTYRTTGQLLSKRDLRTLQITSYDYDELGALRHVTLPSGAVIEYEIDAAGRRVGKRLDGQKHWGLLYQGALRPIAQLDAANQVVTTFTYGTRANVPDTMQRDGQLYRLIVDRAGSVRLVVRVADGKVAQRIDYDEFGVVISDSNPGFQPFGFAGGVYDADTLDDSFYFGGSWTTVHPTTT